MNTLILDTLYDRRQQESDSCLVVNVAGMTLVRSPGDALPVIEQVLSQIVAPATPSRLEASQFPGLVYVVGAYLLIACRTGYDGAVPFLRTMPEAVQFEAMHSICSFFRKMKEGFNFGVAPGKQVFDFLEEVHRTGSAELRADAESIRQFLNSQG